jgi:uncharacterized glyoxalase superfamily protein PhnB
MTDQRRVGTRRTRICAGGLIACVLAAACRSPAADQEIPTLGPELIDDTAGTVVRRVLEIHMQVVMVKHKEVILATTQETVQISSIVPTLTVDDLQKSITFYEALGFSIDERWEEKGTLLGVMLRSGRTEIGLNQDDWKKGRDRKKGIGVRLSISTAPGDVDEIAKRAKNAGITLKSEPHDTEWKSRAFEVSDPSGFLLTVYSDTSA